MNQIRLQQLLSQYFNNTINTEDCAELLSYLAEDRSGEISDAIDHALESEYATVPFSAQQQENIYDRLITDIRQRQKRIPSSALKQTRRFQFWIRIAAILIVSVSAALFFYVVPSGKVGQLKTADKPIGLSLPNHNHAVLTLTNGKSVVVSDTLKGELVLESGATLSRDEHGNLIYDARKASVDGKQDQYYMFSTPKGHSSQLLLSDGTKVWLNTSSSIRYPVVFSSDARNITLKGEAYFDVAHDASKPFIVEARGSLIRVLGTQFNVSAFEDETTVTTTLLTGSVNVSKSKRQTVLSPGQQATVNPSTGEIHQSAADTSSVVAWKNGYFQFENESIQDIMAKISRWYNIESVDYQGDFKDRFRGTFRRSKDISVLFSNLEKVAPYHIEIKGRRVVIRQ